MTVCLLDDSVWSNAQIFIMCESTSDFHDLSIWILVIIRFPASTWNRITASKSSSRALLHHLGSNSKV